MEAAQTLARQTSSQVAAAAAERRCLATGNILPKDELIRFVVGPDKSVVPDLAQNLPGRGLWVTASYDAITQAVKKGLFSKAAKDSVKASPDLAAQVAALLRKRCLDFLGLAKRAGIVVPGQAQVEGELKAGKLQLLLIAQDASADLSAFRNSRDILTSYALSRDELSAALGHTHVAYVGLNRHGLTEKLAAGLAKLEKISNHTHISQANG